MTTSVNRAPFEDGAVYVTDGGLETSMIFHEGIELPLFAAFVLLDSEQGRAALRRYYEGYSRIATRTGSRLVLESPTWRASRDWGAQLGYDPAAMAAINQRAIGFMRGLREDFALGANRPLVSGCIGPRGDGYTVASRMTAAESAGYHALQVEAFVAAGADLVTAMTMNYPEEAIGIARAAADGGLPSVISFTTETDGRLPSGDTLGEAIEAVDAATGQAPAFYMINCAHPEHFEHALERRAPWLARIRGLRANASRKSHAELDEATALDAGDPVELGQQYARLRSRLPALAVVGGCCGTDHRHVELMARACA